MEEDNQFTPTGLVGLTQIEYSNSSNTIPILLGGELHTKSYKDYLTVNNSNNTIFYALLIEKIIECSLNMKTHPVIDIYIEGWTYRLDKEDIDIYFEGNKYIFEKHETTLEVFNFMYILGISKYVFKNLAFLEPLYKKYSHEYKFNLLKYSYSNILDNVRIHDIDIRFIIFKYIYRFEEDLSNELEAKFYKLAELETSIKVFDYPIIMKVYEKSVSLITSENDLNMQYHIINDPWKKLNNEIKNVLVHIFSISLPSYLNLNVTNYIPKYKQESLPYWYGLIFSVLLDIYEVILQLFYLDKNNRNDAYKDIPESNIVLGLYGDAHRQCKSFIYKEIQLYKEINKKVNLPTIKIIESSLLDKDYKYEIYSGDQLNEYISSFIVNKCNIKSTNMIPIITDYIKKNEKSKNIKGYEDLYELCNHIDCKSINSGDPVDFKCLDDFCKKYATIFREQFLINKSEDEIKHGGTINNPYSKLMLSEELELLEYNYKNVNIEKLLEDSFKFYNNIPIKAISYEPPSHTQEMRISSPLYPTGNAFNQSTIAVATGGSVNLLNVIIIVCVLLLMFVVYIRINSVRVSTVNINQLPILYET